MLVLAAVLSCGQTAHAASSGTVTVTVRVKPPVEKSNNGWQHDLRNLIRLQQLGLY
jgi:hypothetical protein